MTKPLRTLAALTLALAAAAAPAAEPAKTPAAAPAAVKGSFSHFDAQGFWRAVRWGMTLPQLLAALPGEARALERPVTLADGNVVAAAIPTYELDGVTYVVRFVFEREALVLLSLRTLEDRYAPPPAYEKLSKDLAERFGRPGEETKDDNFIDLRQTRWRLPQAQVDLKYIPGVVVVLYSAPGTR